MIGTDDVPAAAPHRHDDEGSHVIASEPNVERRNLFSIEVELKEKPLPPNSGFFRLGIYPLVLAPGEIEGVGFEAVHQLDDRRFQVGGDSHGGGFERVGLRTSGAFALTWCRVLCVHRALNSVKTCNEV